MIKLFQNLKNKLKNLYRKLDSLNNITKVVFLFSLVLGMTMCSQAGWEGYYKMNQPAIYKEKFGYDSRGHFPNSAKIAEDLFLSLPESCSFFKFMGIITPFTPPIPLVWLRSWNLNNSCSYFTVYTNKKVKVGLKFNNQVYEATNIINDNYTQHIFTIKAKNMDQGIIIIENNQEIIEIPFEYEYSRFWR